MSLRRIGPLWINGGGVQD